MNRITVSIRMGKNWTQDMTYSDVKRFEVYPTTKSDELAAGTVDVFVTFDNGDNLRIDHVITLRSYASDILRIDGIVDITG